jgi:hypothetical protein
MLSCVRTRRGLANVAKPRQNREDWALNLSVLSGFYLLGYLMTIHSAYHGLRHSLWLSPHNLDDLSMAVSLAIFSAIAVDFLAARRSVSCINRW